MLCGRVTNSPLDFALSCEAVGAAPLATLFVSDRRPGGSRTVRFAVDDVLGEAVDDRNLVVLDGTDTWLLLRNAAAGGLREEAGGAALVALHAQAGRLVELRLPLLGSGQAGGPAVAALSDAEALAWYGRGWDALLCEAAATRREAEVAAPPQAPAAVAAPKRARRPESLGLKVRRVEGGALAGARTI